MTPQLITSRRSIITTAGPLRTKKLVSVTNSDGPPKHIFVGDIAGPEKNDWFVNVCVKFLGKAPDEKNVGK